MGRARVESGRAWAVIGSGMGEGWGTDLAQRGRAPCPRRRLRAAQAEAALPKRSAGRRLLRFGALWALAALTVACSRSAPEAVPPEAADPTTTERADPPAEVSSEDASSDQRTEASAVPESVSWEHYTAGPTLDDPDRLRAWLEAQQVGDGERRTFRFPVTVRFADRDSSDRLELSVGAMAVALDETTLRVPFAHLARELCEGSACALWIEAYWGPFMPTTGPFGEPEDDLPRLGFLLLLGPLDRGPSPPRVWTRD